MGLHYIGRGGWWHGVPARDLTEDEVGLFGGEAHLIGTGLYVKREDPVRAERVEKPGKGQKPPAEDAALDERYP
jgi:hypothetical protein